MFWFLSDVSSWLDWGYTFSIGLLQRTFSDYHFWKYMIAICLSSMVLILITWSICGLNFPLCSLVTVVFFFFLAINKQFVGRHLKIYPALHQNSCLNLASIADIILPWWLQNDSTNLVLPPHLPVGSQHSLRPLFAPIYLFIICINLWIPVFPLYFL